MGNIIHQNILHFSDSFVVSTRIYGFKIKWILLRKSNKNQGDFSLCFCSVWWANLFSSAGTTGWTVCTWTQASCQTHILTWKPSSEASSPGAFDVFKYFASILLFSPSHICVVSIAAALSACLRQVRASWRRRTGSLLTACRKCSQPTSSGTSC